MGKVIRKLKWFRHRLFEFCRRHPVMALLGIIILSNITGSVFNILYNTQFIVNRWMDKSQQQVFQNLVLPVYNLVAYPIGMGVFFFVLNPIKRNHTAMLKGESIAPDELLRCQKTLVNMPFYLICVNFLCWLPGAIFFPAVICALGGAHEAGRIWGQFLVSFLVAAALTVAQTFFWMEEFLIEALYPIYFKNSRPADIQGAWQFSYFWRLTLLWSAVAFMPMIAIVALALNVDDPTLMWAFFAAVFGGAVSGGITSMFVGRGLRRWIKRHQEASQKIAQREFSTRVEEKRPDEWGKLTDSFNDMAEGLEQGEKVRETFGQMIHPEMLDEMVNRYTGLGGEVKDITVLFADIRGFTRRSAGESPEKVVTLLNRFMTLAVSAIEDNEHGWVNKFLGDGLLALFNIRRADPHHADRAVQAALELLERLESLNKELHHQQQHEPLRIGIGIHTGPALVGCVGATITLKDGTMTLRRELTALGETVNLGQRIEQLTKTLGGPILLSECTRMKLRKDFSLHPLGPQAISGYEGKLEIWMVSESR